MCGRCTFRERYIRGDCLEFPYFEDNYRGEIQSDPRNSSNEGNLEYFSLEMYNAHTRFPLSISLKLRDTIDEIQEYESASFLSFREILCQ